jgi:adenosylcobyric acid synthase
MAKPIMIQGTMSSAGKSLITAGLCRIFAQDGYKTAPFKSQNMALNSFITNEGLEMGRAQVMQAEAAMIEPSVLMNPILLKPTNDMGCQVIVRGEVFATMTAGHYYDYKAQLRSVVTEDYNTLASQNDVVVIEGAGSPAEINLNRDDFVNMGMAKIADAPVLLVADIDRGGVFATVYGTVKLLSEEEQSRFKGIIINKFRGDVDILKPGLKKLEELTGIPVLGVVPYLNLDLDDEDSLSERLTSRAEGKPLDIAVIRLPRISNFTDFNALSRLSPVGLRYADKPEDLKNPDLIILPGTKNTMGDLSWMRLSGMEDAVKGLAAGGTPVIGICGGYQMLGRMLSDPDGVESGGEMRGLELLPVDTVFERHKVRTRMHGRVLPLDGFFSSLSGSTISGYEIHMGKTTGCSDSALPFAVISGASPVAESRVTRSRVTRSLTADGQPDGIAHGKVFGSYLHGLFDSEFGVRLVKLLLRNKGCKDDFDAGRTFDAHKTHQYNLLAQSLRDSLDLARIHQILGL